MQRIVWISVWGLSACAQVRIPFDETADLTGVEDVIVTLTRGDADVSVGPDGQARMSGDVWGWGSNETVARERAEGVRIVQDNVGGEFRFAIVPDGERAGGDVFATLPESMDVRVRTNSGRVSLDGIEGALDLEGDRVVVSSASVSSALLTGGSVVARLDPLATADIQIDAITDAELSLPHFGDYDIVINVPAGQVIGFDDLGFDDVVVREGFFSAIRYPGNIRVRIDVAAGGAVLRGRN